MEKFFEAKVKYEKMQEDGVTKKVTETYLVEALSFSECEAKITKEMESYISGDFEVTAINPSKYGELVESDNINADKWYKCKLMAFTLDERTGKEKKNAINFTVKGYSLENARLNMEEFIKNTMIDCTLIEIKETPIMDVFTYKS